MLNRWLTKSEPIGCHIGAGHVRLAQALGLTSAAPRLIVADRPLPEGGGDSDAGYAAAVTARVREMLRAAPFRGSRVVSSAPAGVARYVTMRLAPMPPAELAHAAHWKLSSDLGLATGTFKSAVLNVVEIREGSKQKTEALVVCATTEQLTRHVEMLAAAGLEHVAIDDPACAVVRSTGSPAFAGASVSDRRIILELREHEAFLTIAAGAEVGFIRPVGIGLSGLTKTLADLLEVTPAEAHALHCRTVAAALSRPDESDRPANWVFAIPFKRAREAVADASRMYGRELARQVALATYYYSTADGGGASAPEAGLVVSERALDPAVLEAVTVQSGIDLVAFEPTVASGVWAPLKGLEADDNPSTWATAVGLSLYEHALPLAKEVA